MEDKPDNIDTTIITINKAGIIQSVDNNCCLMFGYSMGELVGKPVYTLIPPPYREQHDTYLSNYHKTGQAKIIGRSRNVEGQHKDGTIFTIRLSVSEIKIPGSTIYVGMIDKLENTTATITADTDGIIMSCNDNCKEVWGYEIDEMKGKNLSMLMPNPYSDSHDQFIKNYHQTGKRNVIGRVRNVPALHKDGTIFPICLQVQRVQYDDITFFRGKVDRVNEENELVFTLDCNGFILSCNQNFVVPLMGYTAADLRTKHIRKILPALQYNRDNHALISRIGKKRSSGYSMPSSAVKIPKKNSDVEMGSSSGSLMDYTVDALTGTLPVTADLESWIGTNETNCRHIDESFFRVSITVAKFTSNDDRHCFAVKVKRVIDEIEKKALPTSSSESVESTGPSTSLGNGKYSMSTKTIGSGSFGRVYLGANENTKEQVAIKLLQKEMMTPVELERAMREVHILLKLRHPNICALYDWYETEDTLHLVMEYARGGELFGFIKERGKLAEAEARHFFKQIMLSVDFCHSNSIIHRDIKDKNILLDDNSNIKLIDFGLSNFTDGSLRNRTFCGTPAYSAPEMVLGTKYKGPEVDVWSLGVVLYFMVSGELPFNTISDITQGVYQPVLGISQDCSDIIRKMLIVSPTERASVRELLDHPFLTRGETKEVMPDLLASQVPEYQHVPLGLITVERTDDDDDDDDDNNNDNNDNNDDDDDNTEKSFTSPPPPENETKTKDSPDTQPPDEVTDESPEATKSSSGCSFSAHLTTEKEK